MKKRVFIDIDGTLAEFRFSAKESDLYERGYFSSLAPQANIISAVKELVKELSDVEFHVLSSCLEKSRYAKEEKESWLQENIPEIANRQFCICGTPKTLAVPGGFSPETDILIDDYGVNCREWASAGGTYVKVSSGSSDFKKESLEHQYVISPTCRVPEITGTIKRALFGSCGGDTNAGC